MIGIFECSTGKVVETLSFGFPTTPSERQVLSFGSGTMVDLVWNKGAWD